VSQTVESLGFNPANPRPHNKGLQPRRTPRTRERIERERTTPAFVSRHGFSRAERQPRRRRFPAAAGCRRNRGPRHARCWRDGVGMREAPGADSPNFPFREPGETRPPETRGFSPGALQPPEHESKESAPHPFLYRGTKADGTGRRRSPNLQSLIPREFPEISKNCQAPHLFTKVMAPHSTPLPPQHAQSYLASFQAGFGILTIGGKKEKSPD
jgi:hypothetical protein